MDFEKLLTMSTEESESFLQDFMESEHSFHHTPAYLKNEILSKCPKQRYPNKHFQLLIYSFKVCSATAFALVFLFSISPTEITTYLFDSNYQENDSSYLSSEVQNNQSISEDSCLDKITEEYNKPSSIFDDFFTISNDKKECNFNNTQYSTITKPKITDFFDKIQKWFQKKYNNIRRFL